MIDRLPALPLIASDPYISVWLPGDKLTDSDAAHWSGAVKPIRGSIDIDGAPYRFIGLGDAPAMRTVSQSVTPTRTISTFAAGGIELTLCFITPALPNDFDTLSMPVTLVTLTISTKDGAPHDVSLRLAISDSLCYDGEMRPAMTSGEYPLAGRQTVWCAQETQKPLCHSGDHITIDWGYLYLSSDCVKYADTALIARWDERILAQEKTLRAVVAYDDIFSINYFGAPCRAYYLHSGGNFTDMLRDTWARFDILVNACEKLDRTLIDEAMRAGGASYMRIICAAYRQVFAAHKLIATPDGLPALLSKENDSNGCIGTVDISYPSSPLFLHCAPELVLALCRPVLRFAAMPVWDDMPFAPHDVGRYPYATGQVYAARVHTPNGATPPPLYLYPAGTGAYDDRYQMPVEECGNMLIMLGAAQHFGACVTDIVHTYRPQLDSWAQYLCDYGADPGEQLCTDDFAGHLARNINLAAKAIVGLACYAHLTDQAQYLSKARSMATDWLTRAQGQDGTALTFDGRGFSMKYNTIWDRVLGLDLWPDEFYSSEAASYLTKLNAYGLPLDSRATYTKSDWMCWVAAMTQDIETREALFNPIARFLNETPDRVAFSDWYDTVTGRYVHFIARSVQGGVFMPLLT